MNVYLFIFELIHTWIVIQCSIYTLSYCVCDYCDWQFDKEKKKKKKKKGTATTIIRWIRYYQ
jgi:hypothetical protein